MFFCMFLSFSLLYGQFLSRSIFVFSFCVVRGVCLPLPSPSGEDGWGDTASWGRAEGELAVWPRGHFVCLSCPRLSPAFLSVPLLSRPSATWGQGLLLTHESARNVFTFSWSFSDLVEWFQVPGREDRPWGDITTFLIALLTEVKG